MWFALLMFACPKGPELPPEDPGKPILPAPEAPVYAQVPNAALRDPLLAWASRGLPVDEALSGAAAGLGLVLVEDPGLDASRVRWAALRAGWPFPVQGVSVEASTEGAVPEAFLIGVREGLQPGQSLGLARVRGPQGDLWVALTSTPTVQLAAFPRVRALGEPFTLSVQDPRGWTELRLRGLSPALELHEGPSLLLDQPGEWVIELEGLDPQGRRRAAVQVPVYAGVQPPVDGPFLRTDSPPADPAQAIREVLAGLDELRSFSEAPALTTDPVLASLARSEASRQAQGGGPPTDSQERLRRAAGSAGLVAEVWCQADTVHACLDGWFWDPDTRRSILDPRFTLVGVGAELTAGQALLVVGLAAP